MMEDALNGIAWKDDSQIVSASISKRYDHNPRLSVVIWYTDEEGNNPPDIKRRR